MKVEFSVRGDPRPQPRPRAFLRPNAKFASMINPPLAEQWKLLVYGAAEQFVPPTPMPGPVTIALDFVFARPKIHFGSGKNSGTQKASAPFHHLKRPDLDNLAKAVKDLLTNMRMWADDSVVVSMSATKKWGIVGGMHVIIIQE